MKSSIEWATSAHREIERDLRDWARKRDCELSVEDLYERAREAADELLDAREAEHDAMVDAGNYRAIAERAFVDALKERNNEMAEECCRDDNEPAEDKYGEFVGLDVRNAVSRLQEYIAGAEAEYKPLVDGKRNESHGAFEDNSQYLDGFLDVCECSELWRSLSATERVAIIMILSKLSRYLSAPNVDHFRDAGGYSYLGKREAERLGHPDSGVKG